MFGQTQKKDSLVTIDISTIREANKKLLEREYLIKLVDTQNSIISDYKVVSEKQDSLIYNYQIENINLNDKLIKTKKDNVTLTNKLNNQKKLTIGLGSATAVSLIILIINFILG